jgi:hypothetical protein
MRASDVASAPADKPELLATPPAKWPAQGSCCGGRDKDADLDQEATPVLMLWR